MLDKATSMEPLLPEIEGQEDTLPISITEDAIDMEEAELLRLKLEIKDEHSQLPMFQRPSLIVIGFLVILFGLSEMLYVTPFISLTMDKICDDLNLEQCDGNEVQTHLSTISSMVMISQGLIGTIMAGKWGQWSDQYGRVSTFGSMFFIRFFGSLCHVFSLSTMVGYNKYLIMVCASVGAFSGGMFGFMGNINSYITDIVESDERVSSMSTIGGIFQAMIGVGPILSSILIKFNGGNAWIPVKLALFVQIIGFIICFTLVKEPRHKDALKISQLRFIRKQEEFLALWQDELITSNTIWFKVNHYGKYHLNQIVDALAPIGKLWLKNQPAYIRNNVIILLVVNVVMMACTIAIMPSIILFCTYKYHWKSVEIGYFISFAGIFGALLLFVESRWLMPYLNSYFPVYDGGVDEVDKKVIKFSLICVIISILSVLLFQKTICSIILFLLFKSMAKICTPVLESSVIKHFKHDSKSTGEIFGAIALINSLAMLILPPIMLTLYGLTVSTNPAFFLWLPLIVSVCTFIASNFLKIFENR